MKQRILSYLFDKGKKNKTWNSNELSKATELVRRKIRFWYRFFTQLCDLWKDLAIFHWCLYHFISFYTWSLKSPSKVLEQVSCVIIPFYRWGNESLRRLNNLLSIRPVRSQAENSDSALDLLTLFNTTNNHTRNKIMRKETGANSMSPNLSLFRLVFRSSYQG